jgi:transcriptional regulator GlxA family with amidase domain
MKLRSMAENEARQIATVLFDDFELLDVCGPLEVFGVAGQRFSICLVGPSAGPVRSAQGPALIADFAYQQAPTPDIVLVPGGIGTRRVVADAAFLRWLSEWAAPANIVASVCTGSGVLAAAGLLDGYRATSNKRAFAWACGQGPHVSWVPQARWVEDRSRWTSSGVVAGIDMALALIANLDGEQAATAIADGVEHDWHRDPEWDPFAAKNGLPPS